jgi:hypothetical protein
VGRWLCSLQTISLPAVAGFSRNKVYPSWSPWRAWRASVAAATRRMIFLSRSFTAGITKAFRLSEIRNLNGTNGMSDMAGGLGSRLERSVVAVECGGRRRDTNLKSHVQHPVQKQGRPVPNRRLEQRSCIRRRHLFEGVVVIVPAPGMANRKHSTDRTFRLVHVHNVRRRHHRHDVGDAVKNRLTNLRR